MWEGLAGPALIARAALGGEREVAIFVGWALERRDAAALLAAARAAAARAAATTGAATAAARWLTFAVVSDRHTGAVRRATVTVRLAVTAADRRVHGVANLGTQATHRFGIGLTAVLPGLVGAVFVRGAGVASTRSTRLGTRRTADTSAAGSLAASATTSNVASSAGAAASCAATNADVASAALGCTVGGVAPTTQTQQGGAGECLNKSQSCQNMHSDGVWTQDVYRRKHQ